MCLAEKQQIPILYYSLWFDTTRDRTQIYRARGDHANCYTTDAIILYKVNSDNYIISIGSHNIFVP